MKNSVNFLIVVTISALSACTLAASTGSVWKDAGPTASMYSDRKAVKVGDVVTVVVQETASVSSSRSTSSEKSSTTQDQLSQLLYSAAAYGASGAPLSKGGELPGVGWSSNRSFEGAGSVSGQQTVQSRLSAVVIDRLPNGNLVIEGIRKVSYTNEQNFVILRGMIRPTDILADNTILSSRIADAEIELIAEGSLSEDQRQGWLNRLYSWLNPF